MTPPRRPFALWLEDQRGGELHDELTDALAAVALAVREHGRVGSLSVTVRVAPDGDSAVMVSDVVTMRVPQERGRIIEQRPPMSGAMFVDRVGNLTRSNPHQPELPLSEVTS